MILNCEIINIDDGTICEQCHPFFGLSDDQTACVPCDRLSEGCLDCIVDDDWEVQECTSCIGQTILEDGFCFIPACGELQAISLHVYKNPAICVDCMDGFGLLNNACYECSNPIQFWNHCADCDIHPSTKLPIDCKSCMFDKNLTKRNAPAAPLHICQYTPAIENCLTMKDTVRECEQCVDTYYSKDNECIDCAISNCRQCHERESEGIIFTECQICDSSYDIVKDFLLGSQNTTRDICGWTR
jgi:hypothetical protein